MVLRAGGGVGSGKLSEEVALGPGLKRKALVLRVLAGTWKRTRRAHPCGRSVPAPLYGGILGTCWLEEKIPLTWRHLYGHCAKETELVAVGYSQWLKLNGGPVPQAGGPSSNPFRRRKSPS